MGKVDVAGILRRDPVSGTVEIHRDEARTIIRYVADLERKLAEARAEVEEWGTRETAQRARVANLEVANAALTEQLYVAREALAWCVVMCGRGATLHAETMQRRLDSIEDAARRGLAGTTEEPSDG